MIGIEAIVDRPKRTIACTTSELVEMIRCFDGGPEMTAYILVQIFMRQGVRKLSLVSCTINKPSCGAAVAGDRINPGGSLVQTRLGTSLQVWNYCEYSNIFIDKTGKAIPLKEAEEYNRKFIYDTRSFPIASIRKMQIGLNMYQVG